MMSDMRKWIALGLSLAAPVLIAQGLLAQTSAADTPAATPHHHSHKKQKELVLPPLPGGPLSQLPMDQIPPAPAKVSFQDGLLAISAQNSTLGEILSAVRQLTGASIEIPPGPAANERVVTNLGPGAPRDVLAVLLNGSSFNYVMLGSNSDPTAVSSVILTSKPSSAGDTQAFTNVAANVYQSNPEVMPPHPQPFGRQLVPGPPVPQPAAADSDDSKDEDQDSADDAEDQAQPGQPVVNPPNMPGAQPLQPDPNQPNAGPKTPQEILQMLQNRHPNNPPDGQAPPQPPQQ